MRSTVITAASFCAFTFYFSACDAEGPDAETIDSKISIESPSEETKCTFIPSIEGLAIEPFELKATDADENRQERVFFDYKVSLSYYPPRGGCCAYPPLYLLWVGVRDQPSNDSGDYNTFKEIQWPNGEYEYTLPGKKGSLKINCIKTELSSVL